MCDTSGLKPRPNRSRTFKVMFASKDVPKLNNMIFWKIKCLLLSLTILSKLPTPSKLAMLTCKTSLRFNDTLIIQDQVPPAFCIRWTMKSRIALNESWLLYQKDCNHTIKVSWFAVNSASIIGFIAALIYAIFRIIMHWLFVVSISYYSRCWYKSIVAAKVKVIANITAILNMILSAAPPWMIVGTTIGEYKNCNEITWDELRRHLRVCLSFGLLRLISEQ